MSNEAPDYITGTALGDDFRRIALDQLVNHYVLKSLSEVLGKCDKVVAIRMLAVQNGRACEIEIGRTELMGGRLSNNMNMLLLPLFGGDEPGSSLDNLVKAIHSDRVQ